MEEAFSNLFFTLSLLDYTALELRLLDKEVIEIATKYCNEKCIDISPRIILSSLLFSKEDNVAFIEGEEKLVTDLQSISKLLVANIVIKNDIHGMVSRYNELFLRWQSKDLEQQEKITKRIEESVQKIMNKAFWDKLYQDLESRKNDSIMIVLEDLKEKVKGLCLKDEMKRRIEGQFDTVIIKQIIDNDRMEIRDFEMFFEPFANTVKSLQSPGQDESFDAACEVVKQQISEDWKTAFISSLKILNEAVAQIYIDLINLQPRDT